MSNWEKKVKEREAERKNKGTYTAVILIVFACLCFITSLMMTMDKKTYKSVSIPRSGGIVGPLDVTKAKSILHINVSQNMVDGQWSFVGGELLDHNKEYVCGFGKEFWAESGQDSEGPWRESVTSYKMKVVTTTPGQYYLNFTPELSKRHRKTDHHSGINVKITQQRGSYIPHFIAGIIALCIGIIINEMTNQTIIQAMNEGD